MWSMIICFWIRLEGRIFYDLDLRSAREMEGFFMGRRV